MLNRMCGASKERVATAYPASAAATASAGAPRVRGDGSERPGYLGANDGWGRSSNARFFDACVAASGWSIANQYTVRKASI